VLKKYILLFSAVVCVGLAADRDARAQEGTGGSYPSDFERVELTRSPGAWFDVEMGDIVSGTIEVANGVATLSGTIAMRGVPPEGVWCIEGEGPTCVYGGEFPARTLTPEELETLRALVAAVPERVCHQQPGLECDPSVLIAISVDGESRSSYCCGDLNADFSTAFDGLVAFIDGLI